jgi:glycerate kinase
MPTINNLPIRILIAPNAFKNSLDAAEAALAIEEGLLSSRLHCVCEHHPIGDGGDGTCDLIIKRSGGVKIEVAVHDPLGRPIRTSYGLIDNGATAVIEMANASGLRLLSAAELDPLRASSYGTGELIKDALDKGVRKIIIGMGGSATVDGACGMLEALGVRFLDARGEMLTSLAGQSVISVESGGVVQSGTAVESRGSVLPETLAGLASIAITGIDQRVYACEFIVLCDVENRLLGPDGAAAVFGPQKGAGPEDLPKLEAALIRYAEIAGQVSGRELSLLKHGGTAGGAAAGLYAFLHARLVNGIDYFLEFTGFEKALERADLVITGEGSIDEQTLQGKGPYGVASRAKARSLPVIGLAGQLPLTGNDRLQQYFDVLLPIGNGPADMLTALRDTAQNLRRTSEEAGNLLAMGAIRSH